MIKKQFIDLMNSGESETTVEVQLIDGSSEAYDLLSVALANLFQQADTLTKEISAKDQINTIQQQLNSNMQVVLEHLSIIQLPIDIRNRLARITQSLQRLEEALSSIITQESTIRRQKETIKSIQAVVVCYEKMKNQRHETRNKLFEKHRQRLSKNHKIRAKLKRGLKQSIEYCDRRLIDFRALLNEQKQKAKYLKRRIQSTMFNGVHEPYLTNRDLEQERINISAISLRHINQNDPHCLQQTDKQELSTWQALRSHSNDSSSYIQSLLCRAESEEHTI